MRSGVGMTPHAATAAGLQRGESILFPERESLTPSRNHAAAAVVAPIADFAPELSGIVAALFPALLEVLAKLFDLARVPLRFATFGELAGSQKAPDSLSLDSEHAADGFCEWPSLYRRITSL